MTKNLKFIVLTLLFILSFIAGCNWYYLENRNTQLSSTNHGSTTINIANRDFHAYHPKSYKLEYLNPNLKVPRIIHFYGDRLFIGSKSGFVYWMDPPYEKTNSIAKLSNYPHSIVIRDGQIYVAQTDGIYRANYDANENWIAEDEFKRYISLPGGPGHNTRTLKLGPDNKLYVALGIRGNCSDEYLDNSYPFDLRRGGIFLIDETDTQPKLVPFAAGLRNPVGFDWHPITKEIYASNNGPDHSGFELPPEYFSKVTENSFHGMPWYQYDGVKLRRDYCVTSIPPKPIESVVTPEVTFPARNAPMDVAFVPSHGKAKELIDNAIVALHGSWATDDDGSANGNLASRRPPKLVVVEFENGKAINVSDLLTGLQSKNSGSRWIRPIGIAIGPDGEIYFTSDAGAQGLYRLKKL